MQRRELIKMGAGALVGANLMQQTLADETPPKTTASDDGSWSFIAVNDLHFHAPECNPWFDRTIEAMKQSALGADFCLLGGDLADEGTREQLLAARDAFRQLGMPLYAVPGNHDHATDVDRTAYDEMFPGQTNQFFVHRGWQFLGLDSTQGTLWQNTNIQPATFAWLDANLPRMDKTLPTVVWTHFPLAEGVMHRPLNASALLDLLAPLNIRACLSGHWHGASQKAWRNATFTTSRCCSRIRDNHDGSKEKGWTVCTVRGDQLERRFVPIPQ